MPVALRRAVAEPIAVIWVPLPLFGANVLLWSMVASLGIGFFALNPLWSVAGAVSCHAALAPFCARDPHFATVLLAHFGFQTPTRSLVPGKGRRFVP
jgi:hypothetical protein